MKVKVCSPKGDTDYFNIVADVLQGDTFAPYLFIICLDYMLRTSIDLMKENIINFVYPSNSRRCMCKENLEATILFIDFSIHRRKKTEILLTCGLLKETVAAIMMLYKKMKVKVCSPKGDTDYFNIVADVLQGDTFAPYLFIICLDYMLRTSIDLMKENGFKLAKERSRRYLAQTIMDVDYADDTGLQANSPAQAKSLLHSLEWAAGISLHVNVDKTENMCFNQRGDIFTLKNGPLKLVDKFTYLGSSVSSTENDINTQLAKT